MKLSEFVILFFYVSRNTHKIWIDFNEIGTNDNRFDFASYMDLLQ